VLIDVGKFTDWLENTTDKIKLCRYIAIPVGSYTKVGISAMLEKEKILLEIEAIFDKKLLKLEGYNIEQLKEIKQYGINGISLRCAILLQEGKHEST